MLTESTERRCFISLGGNVGPVAETFELALKRVDAIEHISVVQRSGVYRTAPVGEQAGGEFLNAAAELATGADPDTLFETLQRVETEFGRQPGVRWGPRTLDLDLLLYADRIIDTLSLQVPHPACWYRRFVLDPLAELAADVVHPIKGVTIGQLLDRLLVRPLPVALAGGTPSIRIDVIALLEGEYADAVFQHWQQVETTSSFDPSLVIWLGPAGSGSHDAFDFEALPAVSRLDATAIRGDLTTAVRQAVQSALGA